MTRSSTQPANTIGTRFGWLLTATAGLLLCMACNSKNDDPMADSQTHWLRACDSSADCGPLSCRCGLCTQRCENESGCSALGDGAVCASTEGISSCGAGATEQVCLAGCENDDDCADGSSCDDHACIPVAGNDDTPPGVDCGDYPSCDLDTPCNTGLSCISFAECRGALCIDADEACELSCPNPSECLLATSYPEQLVCDGKVPANPADEDGGTGTTAPDGGATDGGAAVDGGFTDSGTTDGAVPGGVVCGDYQPCSVETPCAGGVECISFPECDSALCIPSEQACALSCPDPSACAIAESYPEQLACAIPEQRDGGSNGPTPEDDAGEPSIADDAGACPDVSCGATELLNEQTCECESQAPTGVTCGNYDTCSIDNSACPTGADCIAISGCDSAICIPADEACELSCPSPDDCVVMESFPLQIGCPGIIEGSTTAAQLGLLNSECGADDTCPEGLSPVHYFGIAGPSGPEFCSCSILCADMPDVCPDGSACQTIADGPGEVCVPSE